MERGCCVSIIVHTAEELVSLHLASRELIKPSILDRQSKMLVAGEEGIGKSYLVLQLGFELAEGQPAWGQYEVTEPSRVLILQMEINEYRLQQRVEDMAKELGYMPSNLMLTSPRDFSLVESEATLAKVLRDNGIQVLIPDPFYLMHMGSEISAESMLPPLQAMNRIIYDLDMSIIIVDHVKKGMWQNGSKVNIGQDAISGHKAKTRWADTIAMVEQTADGLRIIWTKVRNAKGKRPNPLSLMWTPSSLLVPRDSDRARAEQAKPGNQIRDIIKDNGPMRVVDVARLVDMPDSTVRRHVNDLVAGGRVQWSGTMVEVT